ncbi:hypothetical protein Fmac_020407 [Flemingia macrophylla]|uniref:Uncharacterized protein n=1 Tax=Flemingia macrophylla TaxID=520843 RepID=A0ABD1LU04_9FABA
MSPNRRDSKRRNSFLTAPNNTLRNTTNSRSSTSQSKSSPLIDLEDDGKLCCGVLVAVGNDMVVANKDGACVGVTFGDGECVAIARSNMCYLPHQTNVTNSSLH